MADTAMDLDAADGSLVPCEASVSEELIAPFAELMEDYGCAPENENDSYTNIVTDGKRLECGLMCREPFEHAHPDGEVARCWEAARHAEAIMQGHYVTFGDEGSHMWQAFSLPATVATGAGGGAGAPAADEGAEEGEGAGAGAGALTPERLTAACRGVLRSSLRFETQEAGSYMQQRCAELDAEDRDAVSGQYQEMIGYLSSVPGVVSGPSYFYPLEGDRSCAPVYPHFILVQLDTGSIVGVFTMTVWT